MINILENKDLVLKDDFKIILIGKNKSYSSKTEMHLDSFQEFNEYFERENKCLEEWVKTRNRFSLIDYYVKQGFIVILNITKTFPFFERQLLISMENNLSFISEEEVFNLLSNSEFSIFEIGVHDASCKYGDYCYKDSYYTRGVLEAMEKQKEKSLRLFV